MALTGLDPNRHNRTLHRIEDLQQRDERQQLVRQAGSQLVDITNLKNQTVGILDEFYQQRDKRQQLVRQAQEKYNSWHMVYDRLLEERIKAENIGLFEISVLSVITFAGFELTLPPLKIGKIELKENVLRMAILITLIFRAVIHLQRYFSHSAVISNHELTRLDYILDALQ